MVKALGDSAVVSVHCHDDLGLAVANSLAAVAAGARQIECTINGIGERAGNCSLEEIVMVIKTRHDRVSLSNRHPHRASFPRQPAAELASSLSGRSPTKPSWASNAFAHEAGIHQDGYLKERTTYEIIDPQSVGVPESRLVLGKHSGRHALNQRCQGTGLRPEPRRTRPVLSSLHRAGGQSQEGPDGRRDRAPWRSDMPKWRRPPRRCAASST